MYVKSVHKIAVLKSLTKIATWPGLTQFGAAKQKQKKNTKQHPELIVSNIYNCISVLLLLLRQSFSNNKSFSKIHLQFSS